MTEFSTGELKKLKKASSLLLQAEDRLPVLSSISWDASVSKQFFADKCKSLPKPVYKKIDPAPSFELVEQARSLIEGSSPVHDWLLRLCDVFGQTASMMASVGTKDFYTHSRALYGGPKSPIGDKKKAILQFAQRLDEVFSEFDLTSSYFEPAETLNAKTLKERMDAELPLYFGDRAPKIIVTPDVSAKAAAGRDYIKIRENAHFSDLDVIQLIQHEALVHIATNFNGLSQTNFPILGESHPGNARTQEGLAVFAEFISGALDPPRMRRLANRVIAIDMAENGADFIQIFNFFKEKMPHQSDFEAFENARRIVRGGLVEGGAPFTKDAIYLGGLLDVHNYLRTAVKSGDIADMRRLFVGKFDLIDLEAIKLLRDQNLLSEPEFVPPWISDMRHLVSYLAYSTFLNEINLDDVASQYDNLFETE